MITHDLGVVAEVADDVVVMYAGKVVEQATVDELFADPQHPYAWGLLGSLPRLDAATDRLRRSPGQPPSLLTPPPGCAFHPRCPYVFDRCPTEVPELRTTAGGHASPSAVTSTTPQRLELWRANPASKVAEVA